MNTSPVNAVNAMTAKTDVSAKGNDLLSTQLKSSFSSLMSQSQSGYNQTTVKSEAEFSIGTKNNVTAMAAKDALANRECVNGTTDKAESEVKSQTSSVESNDSVNKSTETDVEDVYGDELKDKLKDLLGLTDEEMETLLAEMGITVMDLFDPQQLQQFVLQSFGASDVSEALVNEDLAATLMESGNILDEVVENIQSEIIDFGMDQPKKGAEFSEVLEETAASSEEEPSEEATTGEDVKVIVNKDETVTENSLSKEESSNNQSSNHSSNDNFVDYFANKVDITNIDNEEMTIPVFKQIVTQVVDQITLNISQAKTSMEVVLNPEALGKVEVVVANKEGMLTAKIAVENQIAKEALESSIQTLKESFENQGLKVEKVEVTIGNYSSEYEGNESQGEEQAKNSGKKKLRLEGLDEESVMDNESETATETVKTLNATVEYTA